MPQLRRRIAVTVASTALVVASPLTALAPSTGAQTHENAAKPGANSARSAAPATRIRKCVGGRPGKDGWQWVSLSHKFPLPARAGWKKRYEMDRWCLFSNRKAKLRIGWAKGVGSMKAMQKRVKRARQAHQGFHLIRLHRLGKPFQKNSGHTAVAEFTFRTANGKRQHVRAVGDKYTVLIVQSSQRAWKHGIGKTAHRAHRKMNRVVMIAL